MDGVEAAERALQPEDLDRLFLERANAGDVDGVVDLYEPDAVLAFRPAAWPPAGRPSGRCTQTCWQAGRG
jgi:ketosteroid isomerase-like protein